MPDLGEQLKNFVEFSRSIEGVVFLVGKLAIFSAVFLALQAGQILEEGSARTMPTLEIQFSENQAELDKNSPISDYSIITSRNIFGAAPIATPTDEAVPKTKLNLRLVGASITDGDAPFAIIENKQKSEQDVFEINESVFGQAKLVEILPQSVKLERSGSIEILLLESGDGSSITEESSGESSSEESSFSITEEELNEELANLPRLLSQARAVPYFRNGASIGMRLFAIRKDSLYDKIGLVNGDIIKEINGNSLSDPSQALKLFEILKNERTINLTLERGGEDKRLEYSIN